MIGNASNGYIERSNVNAYATFRMGIDNGNRLHTCLGEKILL